MFYRGLDMIKYIFLLFILCCSGCRYAQTEDTVIKVSVLRGPSVIAFADWLENPPIIDNKKVQVKVVDSPDLAQALLIKQETDIAVLPMINAANLYNKGIKIKLAILFVAWYKSRRSPPSPPARDDPACPSCETHRNMRSTPPAYVSHRSPHR